MSSGLNFLIEVEPGAGLFRATAGAIVAGALSPEIGCASIVRLGMDLHAEFPDTLIVGDALGISEFVGAHYSHQELREPSEAQTAQFVLKVRAAAQELLRRTDRED